MDNSPFHIPPVPAKLIVIASVWVGVVVAATRGWFQQDIGQSLLIVFLLPAVLLLLLYGSYLVLYVISQIYWHVLGLGAAGLLLLMLGTLFTVGPITWVLAIAMMGLSAVLWRFLDQWLPSETPEQRAVRYTNEERKAEGHPLWDKIDDEPEFPEPQRPRPRRPSPPPGRPDPDRINKEIAARKQRLNP